MSDLYPLRAGSVRTDARAVAHNGVDAPADARHVARLTAIAEAILAGERATEAEAVSVSRYLLAVEQRLPAPLRFGLRAATLAFDMLPLLRHGRAFHRLDIDARARWFARWRTGPLPAMRRFAAYHVALVLFAFHAGRADGG